MNSFISLNFLEFATCMQGLISLVEIDLLREELWLEKGKRERKLVPQKISSKESKNICLISFYRNCNLLVSVTFVLNLSCEEGGGAGESVTNFNEIEISACM